MQSLVVTRRQQNGQDLLLVHDPAGVQIGWYELHTGNRQLDRPELVSEYQAALLGFFGLPVPNQSATPATDVCPAQRHQPSQQSIPSRDAGAHAVSGQRRQPLAQLRGPDQPVKAALGRMFGTAIGSDGETAHTDSDRRVAAQLVKLVRGNGRWHFLSGLRVGRQRTADHLVIGPGGVFAVTGVYQPGRHVWIGGDVLLSDGQQQGAVPHARAVAQEVASQLSLAARQPVPVHAVLAIDAGEFELKAPPAGVVVLQREHVGAWFEGQPERLRPDQVQPLVEAAAQATTWRR